MSSIFSRCRRRSPSMTFQISGSVERSALYISRSRASVRSRCFTSAISSLLFERRDLLAPPLVPSALGSRRKVRVNDGLRELVADDALTERKDVDVHVRDGVARRPFLAHDGGAAARDLAGRDRRSDAAPAAEDATLVLATHDGTRERHDEVHVVDVRLGVRPEVLHLVALPSQVGEELLLETEAGVIAADG